MIFKIPTKIPTKGVHMLLFYEICINYLLLGQLLTFPVCDFVRPNFHLKMRLY